MSEHFTSRVSLRRWHNIKTTSVQRLVCAGLPITYTIGTGDIKTVCTQVDHE